MSSTIRKTVSVSSVVSADRSARVPSVRVRIAHVVNSLDCGGAEQVVASLAACQSKSGHFVRVVCLRDLGQFPVDISALSAAGVEVVTLGKPDGFHLGTLTRLKRYLQDKQIEIVHTHNHIVHHYGAIAGRWAGVSAIINTLHGSSSLQMPLWAKALFWFSCAISDRIVSVCADVDTVFRARYRLAKRKYAVVDNGIGLVRFLGISNRQAGEVVKFGTIARFDPIKDHENLLRAFAILKRAHPGVELRLLGEGGLRRELEELARSLSIDDSVRFEGFSLDTARFLKDIDVYVISSQSEGLPLTLLEAMGAACPIVSTAVGSVPAIVSAATAGWICAPRDPSALAKAMENAVLAPDLTLLGANARQAVERRYSVERMSADYEHLYAMVLSHSPI